MDTAAELAQQGRALLEEAILQALDGSDHGLYNNEIARALSLESDFEGRQRNYLTYSLLGGLLVDRKVVKEKRNGRTYFRRNPDG